MKKLQFCLALFSVLALALGPSLRYRTASSQERSPILRAPPLQTPKLRSPTSDQPLGHNHHQRRPVSTPPRAPVGSYKITVEAAGL